MISNSKLLFCSGDMQTFMESQDINSVKQLFQIPLNKLVLSPDFPFRLLEEWVTLRDRFQLLNEN